MTYQRNIYLEQRLYEIVEHDIPEGQIKAGQEAEDDHDGRRLGDLVSVRPLDPLQLGPYVDEEAEHPAAPALPRLAPLGGLLPGAVLGGRLRARALLLGSRCPGASARRRRSDLLR